MYYKALGSKLLKIAEFHNGFAEKFNNDVIEPFGLFTSTLYHGNQNYLDKTSKVF